MLSYNHCFNCTDNYIFNSVLNAPYSNSKKTLMSLDNGNKHKRGVDEKDEEIEPYGCCCFKPK